MDWDSIRGEKASVHSRASSSEPGTVWVVENPPPEPPRIFGVFATLEDAVSGIKAAYGYFVVNWLELRHDTYQAYEAWTLTGYFENVADQGRDRPFSYEITRHVVRSAPFETGEERRRAEAGNDDYER